MRVTATGPDADRLLDELVAPWGNDGGVRADPALAPIELGELRPENLERSGSWLSSLVTRASLAHYRGEILMLHAAGIARTDGAVAVIIGPSGRGKTTTVRALAQHYGYVSDESIAICDDGAVLPYRKPLSVITEGHVDKLQIAPEALGLRPLPDAQLNFSSFVLLERGDGGDSSVESVPLGAGITALVEQSSYLLEMTDPLRRVAEFASRAGGIRRLRAGSPEGIVWVAEQLFGDVPLDTAGADPEHAAYSPGPTAPWRQLLPADESAPPADGRWFVAGDVVDAVECSDGTVVFTGDRRVQLLTGVALPIWRAVCAGDTWAELVDRVLGEAGPPPGGDAEAAVRDVCEQLVEAGVLRDLEEQA